MKSHFLSPINTSLATQWSDQEIINELDAAWRHKKNELSNYLSKFFIYKNSEFRYTPQSVLTFDCPFPVYIPGSDESDSRYCLDNDKGLTFFQTGLDYIQQKINICRSVANELNIVSSALDTLRKVEKNEPITFSMRQQFEEMIDKEKSKVVEDEESQANRSLENQNKRLNYLDRVKNIILSKANVVSVTTANATLFNRQETCGAPHQNATDRNTINSDISERSGPGYGF